MNKMETKTDYEILKDKVYNYPTESKYGFNPKEIETLLSDFPNINRNKFNNAMFGNTCMVNERDELIMYFCDILSAIRCGLENRELKVGEWD